MFDCHSETTWTPKKKTPIIKTSGARFSVNMSPIAGSKGRNRFSETTVIQTREAGVSDSRRASCRQEQKGKGKKTTSGLEQFLRVVKEALYSSTLRPSIVSVFFRKPSLQYMS
jgi:hypothetical protein